MREKIYFAIAGLLIFFLFVMFSYVVHKDVLNSYDFDTTVRLQDNISRRFDDLFSIFSDIGIFEAMLVMLLGIIIFSRKWLAGLLAIFLFFCFHVIEIFGKLFVDHPPPPAFMLRTKQLIEFPQFYVRAQNSYPSGHSGRTLFVSAFLLILIWNSKKFSRNWKICLSGAIVVYDLIMLISRVYLGEHWATDVIGGSLLGLSFGLMIGTVLWKAKNAEKARVRKGRSKRVSEGPEDRLKG